MAAMGQGTLYTEADFCRPLILVIGGEASGASDFGRVRVNEWVHIPMPGGVESLNASAASAVLLFEVVRQRSQQSG
jgi:tRNA G18 (ribose-2'-O)-methylase SpoU